MLVVKAWLAQAFSVTLRALRGTLSLVLTSASGGSTNLATTAPTPPALPCPPAGHSVDAKAMTAPTSTSHGLAWLNATGLTDELRIPALRAGFEVLLDSADNDQLGVGSPVYCRTSRHPLRGTG